MSDPALRAAITLYDRFTHDDGRVDRRAFMTELTRIAGGAAAASLLLNGIAAGAAVPQVTADDVRIRSQELVWEPRPGRTYRGYNAAPAGDAEGLPVVLVIHENRGLNDHIRDVARRLAVAGFSALAPDFLSPAGGTPADEDRARTMIGALDMAETVADGVATIRWLVSPAGGSRKVGTVGFCWGGAMVNRLTVGAGAALSAGASFYGPAPDPAEAAWVEAAMLIVLAGLDARVNATGLPWAEALRAAGKDVTLLNLPNVDHAFHNDTSAARYNAPAASQAWAAALALFRRRLL